MGLLVVGVDLPDVPACDGHPDAVEKLRHAHRFGALAHPSEVSPTCPQCDGGHAHRFVVCVLVVESTIPGTTHAEVTTVRCVLCGARECGHAGCGERFDHLGPCLADGIAVGSRRH